MYPRIALAMLVLLACLPMPAQVITGTILGTVTDQSEGAVPGAQMTITNSGTGVVTRTTTNAAGEFTAPYLQAGVYEVSIEATGFKTYRQSRIELTLDSKVRVEAKLELGDITQSIQVTADAVTLQTDSSDVNSVVSRQTLEAFPNIGRNPLSYLATLAGAVVDKFQDNPNNLAVNTVNRIWMSSFSVNGGGRLATQYLIDGAPNNSTEANEALVYVTPDAIGELKVITNAYSAEFGRSGGGIVIFGTKSGTNQFHGSLYDYWRNQALNANTFGNNSFGRQPDGALVRPKDKFNAHQFGGTFSGPVYLPKVYRGRNKTFFFVSYEGVRKTEAATNFYTVPTALERQGDFSQTRIQVRDPATGALVLVPQNIFAPFPGTTTITEIRPSTFQLRRQQFQDGGVLNKIPRSMINPVAQRMINLYPLPNIPPSQPDGTGNYFFGTPWRNRMSQITVRLDHNASERHRSFFRFTTERSLMTPPNLFQASDPQAGSSPPNDEFKPTATLGHTFAASATSLFEFRASVMRMSSLIAPTDGLNADLAGLGFADDMIRVLPSSVFPSISVGSYPRIGLNSNNLRKNYLTNFAVSGNWTKIRPGWTHKLGGEFRNMLSNFFTPSYPSMAFGVGNFTRSCGGSDCPTLPWNRAEGLVLADLLIGNLDGLMGRGQFSSGTPPLALGNRYLAFFTQNDWQATRNLTINVGFRWDYQGPLTERYDRLAQFDRLARNLTGTPGRLVFAGRNGLGRGQMDPDYRQLGPRVGYAYRLGDKTVVRSGYGITYDMITGLGADAGAFGIMGFEYPAFMRIRPVTGLDILERPFNNAFNGGGTIVGPNPDDPRLLGLGVVAFDRRQRTPYVQQWNFTMERKLPGFGLTIGYVGSKGTRMMIQSWQINGTNSLPEAVLNGFRDEYIRTGSNPANQLVANPFYGIIPTSNPDLSGPYITRLNLNKPFPAYGSVAEGFQRQGSSSYNALQVTGRRPFSKGFEVTGTYTWSKNIDFGSSYYGGWASNAFTVRDWGLQRSVSANDIPHRATLSYVWELPFGKGKPWLKSTPVLSQLAGGWKLGGLTTWSAGFPLGITGGTGFGRPDLVGDPVLPKEYRCFGDGVTPCKLPDGSSIVVPNRRLLYFNPKAFYNRMIEVKNPTGSGAVVQGDVYWYGTAPRLNSRLRGPGINNFNMSITRSFPIREGIRADLRVDALNAFNRTEFDAPDTGFGSANASASRGPLGLSSSTTFGTINITAYRPTKTRYLQLSLRVSF